METTQNTSAMRRAGHCAIVSPSEPEKIILYGGSIPDSNAAAEIPELVIFDTNTLAVVPISTNSTRQSPCSSSIPVHLSGPQVLFLGGGDYNTSVKGGCCCLNAETLHWTENFLDCVLLEGLMGAKGVVYENKVYIYGGDYVDQMGTYLPTLIELTFDQNCNIVRTRSFTSVNLSGRYNHVLFRCYSNIYLLQGCEFGNEVRTNVYYMDLKTLPNENESLEPTNAAASMGPRCNTDDFPVRGRLDGKDILLRIPMKRSELVLAEDIQELRDVIMLKEMELMAANDKFHERQLQWEVTIHQKNMERRAVNEKLQESQAQVEALRTENSRLKSDLEKSELERQQIHDKDRELKSFISFTNKDSSKLISSNEVTQNEDTPQTKRHRAFHDTSAEGDI